MNKDDKDKPDNKDDRSLDYLIYDGMGQVTEDGKVLGSVRP